MPHITTTQYANAIYAGGVAGANSVQVARDSIMAVLGNLNFAATNIPTGGEIGGVDMGKVGPKSGKIVSYAQKVHSPTGTGQIALVFVGETHTSAKDANRAGGVIDDLGVSATYETVLVIERGLAYASSTVGQRTIRETDLGICAQYPGPGGNFGLNSFSIDIRTVVVAGYLFAYLASDDQNENTLFAAFFGERHNDLGKQLEYFITNGGRFGADWVARRPRSYSFAPSQA